jgi:flagellar hook-associated protein 3 FlgL
MRVTAAGISQRLTADLQAALAALTKQQSHIASGRRINAPSDDPGGTAQALGIRSRRTANQQFQRNVDDARGTLASADTALRSVIEAMQHAKELALQAASDSNDAMARASIAIEIDHLLEDQVTLANSRGPRGTMLFAGQEITVPPYTVTRDPLDNTITAVTANPRGIDDAMPVEVAEGLTVVQGVSGNTVFGALTDPTNVFDTLIRLREALEINDAAAVQAELDVLDDAHDRVVSATAMVGTRLGWLDSLETRLKDEELVLDSSLGRIEDLDIAKAATDMRQIQAFYEAGLASGARLLQQSLIDFLR